MIEKPILLDIPDTIETERLMLRVPRAGDGEVLNAAIRDSFKELNAWFPWAKEMPSPEQSEEWVRTCRSRFEAREEMMIFLFLKGTDSFVGSSGLRFKGMRIPKYEIGYWCRTPMTGNGYISESTYAIASFAFDSLAAARVIVRADETNSKSWRLAERLGFTLEGTERNGDRNNAGELRNRRLYSVISKEELIEPSGA